MNAQKILVATDFSACLSELLSVAESLARTSGAEVIIAHVQQPPVVYGSEGMITHLQELDAEMARGQLDHVQLEDPAIAVRRELLVGVPAIEIVALAEAENVDLIVIGSHGRRGWRRLLMGSVAEAVVRSARCPVLTVKTNTAAKIEQPQTVGV